MQKKAIIFDLDNTIYSVYSIGEELFARLFKMIEEDGNHKREMDKIRNDIMRRPFQAVAKDYTFNDELTQKGEALLKGLTYKGKIEPFEDYKFVKELLVDKFLVTTGFLKLQQSKIEGMKITSDFKAIRIIDPSTTDETKKEVFAEIIERNHYQYSEVLIVGDDLGSEIKAARELGIEAVLYDKIRQNISVHNIIRIEDFRALKQFI